MPILHFQLLLGGIHIVRSFLEERGVSGFIISAI